MKKFVKILAAVLGVLVVLVAAGFVYFNIAFPKVEPPTNIKVDSTPERLARGKYLANHVAVCMDCHSKRDLSKYSMPIIKSTFGSGGDIWDEKVGFPGKIVMKNITPAAIGNWTDGELIRAITCGVDKNGKSLFPIMPYLNYNKLSMEDLYSIIAYVRSLQPIPNKLPDTELNFPLNYIVKTMPVASHSPMTFDKNNPIEFGKYLVTIAGCKDCHSKTEKGEIIEGMEFAGGEEFPILGGTARSANITPENETGIGNWTKEFFIKRFKDYTDSSKIHSVAENEFNTPMPWLMYAGMTEEDLSAIYDYLKTVKPVRNQVERFTPKNVAMK
ncbi:MAG: c-type cytochrome [Ignavibacteriaceae bacterium]|nr:c-type cytochrome [Ignavibacteriaceae bacterium]